MKIPHLKNPNLDSGAAVGVRPARRTVMVIFPSPGGTAAGISVLNSCYYWAFVESHSKYIYIIRQIIVLINEYPKIYF